MDETAVVGNLGNQVGTTSTPQFINPLGLVGHLLVQFWTGSSWKIDGGRFYKESTIDPNKYHIIGCDEDERNQLSLYRSHFHRRTIRSYSDDVPKGVIDRVFRNNRPELSPNISYYSEDEYPHRDFALTCGILSSFCFPFYYPEPDNYGVVEIVSTCNQDVGTLRKFYESFKGLYWSWSFPHHHGLNWSLCFSNHDFQEYAIPEIDHFLKVVCQKFYLPLTQYWKKILFGIYLVHQFSYSDFETLAPWCQFKDACLHRFVDVGEGPLGNSNLSRGAFFCRDITALSITKYPFAHYARNCGSISCFTIYLRTIAEPDEEPAVDCILEFFLPAQQIDNDYPQTFFNSLWATMNECLPSYRLATGEQLGQGFSVEVIKSKSSTYNEPVSFEVGQPHSSLPHHGGSESEYSSTRNSFENSTEQRSISNSYKGSSTGETSSQDFNMMTVKVTYNTDNIRFELPSSSGMAELEDCVIERLHLDRKSFSLKYQDDEGEWVLIACDKDVQECMKISRSLKKTTIKMLLGPSIDSYAP